MAAIEWKRDMPGPYGILHPVAPALRRIICRNPSAFTLHGTATYVVGQRRVVVVDPGPEMAGHVEDLLAALGTERVEAIVVTHTHRDHSPGAALLAEKTGANTYGFGRHANGRPASADVDDGGADLAFDPDVRLADGDVLDVGSARLIAVHTPGHCHNHLCLRIPDADAVLTGDHVMAWSTTVVAPPDGHMGDYMRSLSALQGLPEGRLVPAHGSTIEEPQAFLKALLAHRRQREAQVLQCLSAGITRIPEMVARMYPGLAAALQHAAACSVLAHALYLRERDLIDCAGPPDLHAVWHLK